MADNVILNTDDDLLGDGQPALSNVKGQAIDDGEGRGPERSEGFASEVASIQVARFSPLSAGAPPAAEPASLDLLLDVPLRITVELGRAHMAVRDVLALQTGSVVELDRAAGQPVDVLVNDRLIAHGEVVVIEDRFGVRITDIVSPTRPASAA